MRSDGRFAAAAVTRIDEVVDTAVEQGQAPGIVAAVARDDTVHVSIAGTMAIGGPPIWRDTLFRISSTTKPITTATVLALVDEGVLKLDGPIDDLLPELANRRVLRRPRRPAHRHGRGAATCHRARSAHLHQGFGMQGAMFMAAEPWPIFTATIERQLSTFGPPQTATMLDSDTWLAQMQLVVNGPAPVRPPRPQPVVQRSHRDDARRGPRGGVDVGIR